MFMYSKGLGITRRRTDRRTDVYDYISLSLLPLMRKLGINARPFYVPPPTPRMYAAACMSPSLEACCSK